MLLYQWVDDSKKKIQNENNDWILFKDADTFHRFIAVLWVYFALHQRYVGILFAVSLNYLRSLPSGQFKGSFSDIKHLLPQLTIVPTNDSKTAVRDHPSTSAFPEIKRFDVVEPNKILLIVFLALIGNTRHRVRCGSIGRKHRVQGLPLKRNF